MRIYDLGGREKKGTEGHLRTPGRRNSCTSFPLLAGVGESGDTQIPAGTSPSPSWGRQRRGTRQRGFAPLHSSGRERGQQIQQTADPRRATLRRGRGRRRGHDRACPSIIVRRDWAFLLFVGREDALCGKRVQDVSGFCPTAPRDAHAEAHERQVLRGMSICA